MRMPSRSTLGPRILELRIHGIKNTPPAEMLETSAPEVVADHADDLGGFWSQRSPTAPAEVKREAYSWGALARSGGGSIALLGQFFVHLAWFLLLPFGLTNLAYWTRRIPDQDDQDEWRAGHGAAYLRWFALGLTVLYVVVLATVALDVIGVQCYRAVGVCAQLPEVFDSIAGLSRAGRIAILALVPLATVVFLWLLSHRSRMRYEPGIDSLSGRPTTTGWPVLGSAAFWSRARLTTGTERLHVAAAAFTLAALIAWDHIFSPYPECAASDRFVSTGCLLVGGPLWSVPWTSFALLVAVLGIVVVVAATGPASTGFGTRARSRWSAALLICSLAVFAATAIVTSIDDPGRPGVRAPFVGLVSVPINLIGILLVLCIAALGWRRGVSPRLTVALIFVTIAVPFSRYLLVDAFPWGAENPEVYVVATGLAVAAQVLTVCFAPRRRREATRFEGWRGAGPGVVMLIALGIAMTFSTMLVAAITAWLSRPVVDALCNDLCGRVDPTGLWRGDGVGPTPPPLALPGVFADFAFGFIVAIIVLAVVVAAMVLRQSRGFARLSTPGISGRYTNLFDTPRYDGSRPTVVTFPTPPPPRVLSTRRMSALMQRAEPVIGLLAVLFGLALTATAAPEVTEWTSTLFSLIAPEVSLAVIATITAAAITAVGANAFTTKERPLGLLWDLICFLPRAGHPFAPPCYAERVVPEINARVRAWLAPRDAPVAGDPVPAKEVAQRSVVLSAHSLGAVLAVSCLFSLRNEPWATPGRFGLITYGTQLRPYFGRFFPELFGPAVLGTRPCRGPSLFGRDPWLAQVLADEEYSTRDRDTGDRDTGGRGTADPASAGSLVDLLSPVGTRAQPRPEPAWVSLWRRTDFLGFPVMSYSENPIDRGASELDRRTYLPAIATHGHYPLAPQYEAAFAEVVGRMGHRLSGSRASSSSP